MLKSFAMRIPSFAALILAVAAGAGVAACQGCQTLPPAADADDQNAGKTPTLRLYLVSTPAGMLEPCGCTKDQLGGIDHLAAHIASEGKSAKGYVVLGAGPLLFDEPVVKGDETTQATWSAEAMAAAMKDIGLVAWAPGANDWATGAEALGRYRDQSGAALLAANLKGAPGAVSSVVREVAGLKVGVVGVADPKGRTGGYPEGVSATPPLEAIKAAIEDVKKQGARILVGLAALPRGEALRLADSVPELHVLVVGKPSESGHTNDLPKPPVLAGSTLVVEAANHLQSVGMVDLFIGGDAKDAKAPIVFKDAGGVAKAEEILSLSSRIRELEARINNWENDNPRLPRTPRSA